MALLARGMKYFCPKALFLKRIVLVEKCSVEVKVEVKLLSKTPKVLIPS